MAKEINQVLRGTSTFNLVGKAIVNSYTFSMDKESKSGSDWVYNQMQLKVKTNEGDIQAEMMGGYGSARKNQVYVHGTKVNDNGKTVDDFKNSFVIDWEDRFDEEILEKVGERCFINVGIEKDENGKVVYKKFLSEYDAIQYIESGLKDGDVVNVKGDLSYQMYNGNLSVKKNIRSIVLSNKEEKDFKATFTQTILTDNSSLGKPDKETRTLPIDCYIVDFSKEFDGKKIIRMVNGKKKEGLNIPMPKTFDFRIGEDLEKAKKMVKYFKAKNKKVSEITVDGIFTKGGNLETVQVTIDDVPEDIKELIELGMIDETEVLEKIAFANGGNKKPEQMIILRPHVDMVANGDQKTPSLAVVSDKYNEDDLMIENVLEVNGARFEDEEQPELDLEDDSPFGTEDDTEDDIDWGDFE